MDSLWHDPNTAIKALALIAAEATWGCKRLARHLFWLPRLHQTLTTRQSHVWTQQPAFKDEHMYTKTLRPCRALPVPPTQSRLHDWHNALP